MTLMEYGVTIEGVEFKVLAEAGEYSYDWTQAALLQHPDGSLFYFYDSGCSCNYFGDGAQLSDLTPVTSWQQAVELARGDFYEDRYVADFAKACLKYEAGV